MAVKVRAHPGAPERYDEAASYFDTVSDRAEAFGVERSTIRVWDEGSAKKLRRESRERASILAEVCRDLSSLMEDRREVGRWLLTPQPGLRGERPTAALLRHGTAAAVLIGMVARGLSPVRPDDVPDSETFWRVVAAKLPQDALDRLRQAQQRAEGFEGPLSVA